MGLLVTLYLIASNTFNSVKAPQNRGFSYIEIWTVGVQIPILMAIFEYGFVLALLKYKTYEYDEEKLEMGMKIKKIDMWSSVASAIFIALFDIIYWAIAMS